MIKKFVSNALLSVVMDKKARDKLNALNEKPAEAADDDEMAIPRMLPKRATASGSPKSPQAPSAPRQTAARPPSDLDDDDPATLIRDALTSAEEELERKRNRTYKGKPITAERAALIEQAMAIHKSQSHILDELDQDQRDKLTYMALQALNEQTRK